MSDTRQRLAQALGALCAREGYKNVAATIGSSYRTLWQIVHGSKSETGRPRGIGVRLQERLDEHYPGWANNTPSSATDRDTVLVPLMEHARAVEGVAAAEGEAASGSTASASDEGEDWLAPADVVFTGSLPLSRSWLRANVPLTSIGGLRYMYACGNDMEPTIHDGDTLLVDTAQDKLGAIRDGVYALQFAGFYTVRRLRRMLGGSIEVSCDAPTVRGTDTISPGSSSARILGRVVYVWHGARL